MENKYPEGSVVYANVDPATKLEVRRFVKRIYYCTRALGPDQKDLVFYERELTNVAP
ncbi:hypothetical protein [Pontibacter beigongshangensis]|uniref:hypothetical protein n=1 Tax=Pontibacter beigongshangensis TaxID=2574733 RepID=UPI001650156B|nr:hypothetical protein [Pontibacter beigongshangensis]